MNAYEYILSKQIHWALNNDIKLIGSQGERGRLAYTQTMNDNLFEPLTDEIKKAIEKGDGGELIAKKGASPKIHAVHSSSALGVNIFQYWATVNQVPAISKACKLCSPENNYSEKIEFEVKHPISEKFQFSPNIDVVIKNSSKHQFQVFAIECKFSEAYTNREHGGIKHKYIELKEIWEEIANLNKLACEICPKDKKYKYLHAAQLIKHVLGLKNRYGKTKFRLLYLWYDVLGEEGAAHRKEIRDFKKIAKADNISFSAISYQELIINLAKNHRDRDTEYIKYITERYL